MKTVTEAAIKAIIEKAEKTTLPSDAQQFSQAALNLAHTYAALEAVRLQSAWHEHEKKQTSTQE